MTMCGERANRCESEVAPCPVRTKEVLERGSVEKGLSIRRYFVAHILAVSFTEEPRAVFDSLLHSNWPCPRSTIAGASASASARPG